jgi:hypothetical protein
VLVTVCGVGALDLLNALQAETSKLSCVTGNSTSVVQVCAAKSAVLLSSAGFAPFGSWERSLDTIQVDAFGGLAYTQYYGRHASVTFVCNDHQETMFKRGEAVLRIDDSDPGDVAVLVATRSLCQSKELQLWKSIGPLWRVAELSSTAPFRNANIWSFYEWLQKQRWQYESAYDLDDKESLYGEVTLVGMMQLVAGLPAPHAFRPLSSGGYDRSIFYDLGSGLGKFCLFLSFMGINAVDRAVCIERDPSRQTAAIQAAQGLYLSGADLAELQKKVHPKEGVEARETTEEKGGEERNASQPHNRRYRRPTQSGRDGHDKQAQVLFKLPPPGEVCTSTGSLELRMGDAFGTGSYNDATHIFIAATAFPAAWMERVKLELHALPNLRCLMVLQNKLSAPLPPGITLCNELRIHTSWTRDARVRYYCKSRVSAP